MILLAPGGRQAERENIFHAPRRSAAVLTNQILRSRAEGVDVKAPLPPRAGRLPLLRAAAIAASTSGSAVGS
jgi:hypothetical protein